MALSRSWSCFKKNSSTGEAELCQTSPSFPARLPRSVRPLTGPRVDAAHVPPLRRTPPVRPPHRAAFCEAQDRDPARPGPCAAAPRIRDRRGREVATHAGKPAACKEGRNKPTSQLVRSPASSHWDPATRRSPLLLLTCWLLAVAVLLLAGCCLAGLQPCSLLNADCCCCLLAR
jgi:hypothetical protein